MILTCPECATSYFVDDARIPAGGRAVKCSNCGVRWHAGGDAPSVEPPSEPAPLPEAAAETPASDIEADDIEIAAADELERELEPEPSIEIRHNRYGPSRHASRRAAREAQGAVFVWIGAAAAVAGLVAGAIVFRAEVVRLFPMSRVAYASLGLAVNDIGVLIEGVRVEPVFLGGRPALSIVGTLRNVRGAAVVAPPLRINLLNRAGKPVAARIVRPLDPNVPAGASRHFSVVIADPPSDAQDLDVGFEIAPAAAKPSVTTVPLAPSTPSKHD